MDSIKFGNNEPQKEPLKVRQGGEVIVSEEGILIEGYFKFNRLLDPPCSKHVALAVIDWTVAKLLTERENICLKDEKGCTCNE